MNNISTDIKNEVTEMVYEFFAEECETERKKINGQTLIIEELGGDSLMFVELLELIQKKYNLDIKLQAIGKYLLKKPAETIDEVIDTAFLVYKHENGILDLI